MATTLGLLVIGACAACGSSADDRADPSGAADMVDSGSWYVREHWPHDGQPVESEHFVVYSDAAGPKIRQDVADVAEDVWAELLDEFAIEPRMLDYPELQDRLDIYAYRNRDPQAWAARAYYGGLIVWSPDHPQRGDDGQIFAPVIKHELVHVLQWLIAGPETRPVDTWFLEGLPEYVAGGTAGGAIKGHDELDDLTAQYGAESPIAYKTYEQITDPGAGERFNYPMFHLAVEYLMDDDGYGRSPVDARDVLIDVAAGTPFEDAFEDRMGVRLVEYEREFFDRMDTYLPEYRNPVFGPVGFALLSALVIVLVLGAPSLGARHWRLHASTPVGEQAAPSRLARIGFVGSLIVSGAIVVVFFLGVLLAVGTTNELNNAIYSQPRRRASWVLIGYLFASVGLGLWAVRGWINRSRWALLLAPLVVVATGIAAFVVAATLS